ncbi:nicotinate-nucleotide adenylyltransferase [Halanaerobium sp. Z-7514]|uniref:Probable nicotinate-nucleotide adenylyltransferase n=1 Tax=Halanaerobium polyolivorans TaxID=2886943 RepID=A0AAW4X0W2_9FIRM|nr:nicotinate-nucleotide adenylyltransferase [Halanaerobium polyolivorans]MCC3145424.1 nicotinate-nucleotide adenylyltransferase [Halanaerobium polyolivorans]RQD78448.1 MAG: nicotinate-nucleotide adenylyltransferase [Halanaerobium sp. MSAO_Bac5]
MSNNKVAIFGGTFDPPHLGHLILSEQIKNYFGLDKIIFMPAGRPPHKRNQCVSSDQDRLKMVELAVEDNPFFEVSDWEIRAEGYSYTARTLKEFVPTIAAKEVFFIIGADSLADIFDWHKPEYLLANGKFIVFKRPGYDLDKILAKEKYQAYLDNLKLYQGISIDLSSSFIRDQIKKNNSIKYLSRDNVVAYIDRKKLYR